VPPGNGGSLVNAGTLRAASGGTLLLSAQTNNSGGVINVQAGSTVIQNGISITGGTVSTVGGGSFQAVSSYNNFLDAVTLNGNLDLTSYANARQRVVNGITLNGSVNVANGGILSLDSSATVGSNQSVNGNAVINLNDAYARLAIEGSGTTTLAAGVTVRGQGNLGQASLVGGNNTLINNGLVSADVMGGTLHIVAPGNGGSFINNGTVQAVGGGTVVMNTAINNSATGVLQAGAGSTLIQNGVVLNGAINVHATGSFQAVSSYNNFLDAVTLNGNLDLTSYANARQRVANGITLNGSINVANGGILSLDSSATVGNNQSINGNAVINLNDAYARLAIEGSGTTTLAAGVTVRGQGNIGQASLVGGNNTLINNGLVSADVAGGTLHIVAPGNGGSFINNGTVQAVGGGTVVMNTAINNSATGVLSAGAASTLIQNGVVLNGAINVHATGSFKAVSSYNNFLDAVTLNGNLDLTSYANARQRVVNGITLNGSVNVANGGILSLDSSATVGSNQSVNGNAVINLNDAYARLAIEGSGTTTLGAGVTVRGQGNIGQASLVGGNNTLINNGLISADVAGGTLSIVAPANAGSLLNNGTLQATAGSTLVLPTNFVNNGWMKGTGTLALAGTLTNDGTLAPGSSPGTLGLTGNYLQGAAGVFAVELQSLANHDLFNVSGTAAVGGTLALSCFGACSFNVGDVVTILDAVGDLSGSFASITLNGFATGAFTVVYDAVGDKVDLLVTQTVTAAVPEPGTYAMLLAGLGLLGGLAKRRGRQAHQARV
jgi:hypothetical protein